MADRAEFKPADSNIDSFGGGRRSRKIRAKHEVPKHHFRLFGNAVNEPPFDASFGVRTIGWWGTTEAVAQGLIGDALTRNRPMTTGRPAAGYGIRVVRDDDLSTAVEPGETGHLQVQGVRGIQIFSEYLNNWEAMRESFTVDGWFITGDRVTLDADGMITFADRDKGMARRSAART